MKDVGFLAVAALAFVGPANAAGPSPLLPSSKWEMSGKNGRCILSRNFDGGREPITLLIEPVPLDDAMDLTIKTRQRTGQVVGRWARIGLGSDDLRRRLFSFDSSDGIHRVHRFDVGRSDLDRDGQSGPLRLVGLDDSDMIIALPGLSKALEVLRQCEQEIVENVGLSREEIQAIERQPEEPQILTRYGPEYHELSAKGDLEDVAIAR